MRIAKVAPLYESVPPQLYGGTERVVSYLTEALVKQGNDVTLFASGDSITEARLIPGCERSLRLSEDCIDLMAHRAVLMDEVLARASEFDMIHFHTECAHFAFSKILRLRNVTTLHGRLDLPDLKPLYRQFRDMPLISVSLSQRTALGNVNWVGNVYHGLPTDLYTPREQHEDYLAFFVRISPDNRPDRAFVSAFKAGMPLKIPAKRNPTNTEHYHTNT